VSVREHISNTKSLNFAKKNILSVLLDDVAQSFSGGVAICYVLPVMSMASCLPIIGQAKATSLGCVYGGLC